MSDTTVPAGPETCVCGRRAPMAGICFDIDGDFWPGHGAAHPVPAVEPEDWRSGYDDHKLPGPGVAPAFWAEAHDKGGHAGLRLDGCPRCVPAVDEDRERLAAVREKIAALIKKYPDSSHGEDYWNSGAKAALRIVDIALDAPCDLRPTRYGQWCELHTCPVGTDEEHALVDGRCAAYRRAEP